MSEKTVINFVPHAHEAIVLDAGQKLVRYTPERAPEFVRQQVAVDTLDSLRIYLTQQVVDPKALALYFYRHDGDNGATVQAILDHATDARNPGLNQHTVEWELTPSLEVKPLLDKLDRWLAQEDFCHLIEATQDQWSNGAELLQLVEFFEATEITKVVSRKPLQGHAGVVMHYAVQQDEGSVTIPSHLKFSGAIYEGSQALDLPVMLGWKTEDGKPKFKLRCPELPRLMETATQGVLVELASWLGEMTGANGLPDGQKPKWEARPLLVQGKPEKLALPVPAVREEITGQAPGTVINNGAVGTTGKTY